MTKTELLEHKDFERIVQFIVRKRQIKTSLTIEEIAHEARIHIFLSCSQKVIDTMALTSIIAKNVIWAMGKIKALNKAQKRKRFHSNSDVDSICSDTKSIDAIDAHDFMEELWVKSEFNDYDKNLVMDVIGHNEMLVTIGKEQGVTRENIRQKVNHRLKVLRKHSGEI